jgi:flavin-binding protein dodecin
MSDSVYKIIEIIGSSTDSWEEAAQNAIKSVEWSLRDLRIAEVVKLDMVVQQGRGVIYRARMNLSFKVELD